MNWWEGKVWGLMRGHPMKQGCLLWVQRELAHLGDGGLIVEGGGVAVSKTRGGGLRRGQGANLGLWGTEEVDSEEWTEAMKCCDEEEGEILIG
jgi:hypothetical protein